MKQKKLVTINNIAEEAGVSASTVCFALNEPDRVAQDTRRHVLRIAREMGYSRIRKLAEKGQIGLISDDYYNLIFGEFYNAVAFNILDELKRKHVNVLVESTGKDPEYFPKMITKSLVDGVLFLGKSSRDLIYIAQQKGIPVVLVGHPLPETEIPTVVPDGRSGAFQAVSHLIGLGHKKIAIITGEAEFDPIVSERLDGYRFALEKSGIAETKAYISRADFGKPETAAESTENLLSLKDPPTAIFCTSDSLAYRVYKAVNNRGLSIPDDISIVGFDEISAPEYALLPEPALTTVSIDRKQMAIASVEILFDLIKNKSKAIARYTIPVKLVIKKSTSSPRK